MRNDARQQKEILSLTGVFCTLGKCAGLSEGLSHGIMRYTYEPWGRFCGSK